MMDKIPAYWISYPDWGELTKMTESGIPSSIVLIVDDDPGYGRFLERITQKIGVQPLLAKNLAQARSFLAKNPVRLVLLDRVLGKGEDGLKLCLEIKKDPQKRLIPVIVLTGLMDDFEESVKGYKHGADLYLSKYTPLEKIVKYVKAFLCRLPHTEKNSHIIAHGNIVLDLRNRTVQIDSTRYRNFPEKQFHLLTILVSHEGETVSRRQLLRKLWKKQVRDKDLDVLASRLRHRLGNIGCHLIGSVRGHGYRLLDPTENPKPVPTPA